MRLPATRPTLADSYTDCIGDLNRSWADYLRARMFYVQAYAAAHRATGMAKLDANKRWESAHTTYTDARDSLKEAHRNYKTIFRDMDQGKQL